MNQILNECLKILTKLNLIFHKTKKLSNRRKRTRITTTDPMNMRLFTPTLIIIIAIMKTISPFFELGFHRFKNINGIVRLRIRINDARKNTVLVSHLKHSIQYLI